MAHNGETVTTTRMEPGEFGKKALILKVGNERYGLLLDNVVEVFETNTDLMCIPGAPAWILGLANNHGRVVPVVSLGVFWELETGSRSNHIVLVECEDESYGLAVDRIESMDTVSAEGPEVRGRRRCWHHGALLELIDPTYLTKELFARLDSEQSHAQVDGHGAA